MSDFANIDGFDHKKVGSDIVLHVVSNWTEYEAFTVGDLSYPVPIDNKTGIVLMVYLEGKCRLKHTRTCITHTNVIATTVLLRVGYGTKTDFSGE